MVNEKRVLHFNNYAITGGVPSFIMTFARTFPEFQHYVVSLKEPEELGLVKYLQWMGIRYAHADRITREIIDDIKPAVVVFHNITPNLIENREIFYGTHTIVVYHNQVPCIVRADIDYFVSEHIGKKYKRELCKKALTIPPCIYADDYINITRPKREMVIGRIQSSTRGEITDEFMELLQSVEDTSLFVVGKGKGNNIMPGKMPQYLQEIDVLAIWSNGPESWSMVTTESMLSGIPVVAYNREDGLAEQMRLSPLKDFLVDTEDEFKEKLEWLRDNPVERLKLGKKAKKWAMANASHHVLREALINDLLEWI